MTKRSTKGFAEVAADIEPHDIKALFTYVAISFAILIAAILLASHVLAEPAPQERADTDATRARQPIELGDVGWLRDLDTAVANSKKQNKPIAILFQEVPG